MRTNRSSEKDENEERAATQKKKEELELKWALNSWRENEIEDQTKEKKNKSPQKRIDTRREYLNAF